MKNFNYALDPMYGDVLEMGPNQPGRPNPGFARPVIEKPGGNMRPITQGTADEATKKILTNAQGNFNGDRPPPGIDKGTWLAANMEFIGKMQGKKPAAKSSNWSKGLSPEQIKQVHYQLNLNATRPPGKGTRPDDWTPAEIAMVNIENPFEKFQRPRQFWELKPGIQSPGENQESITANLTGFNATPVKPPGKSSTASAQAPLDRLDQITQARDIFGNEIQTADMLVSGGVKLQKNQRADMGPKDFGGLQFRNVGGQTKVVGGRRSSPPQSEKTMVRNGMLYSDFGGQLGGKMGLVAAPKKDSGMR
jgi:hypothetical protein